MEDLIPFLFFIIVVILSALAKVKKEKQDAKPQGGEGLAARIHAWLTDLKKHIETQSKKAHKGKFEWEQLMGRSQPESTHPKPYDDALEDMDRYAVKETPPPPEAKPFATSPQPHMPIKPSKKPKMMAAETPRESSEARRKPIPAVLLPTDRSSLQQAIVWSEIIGPPIALRDPFGENR